jgi:hypothetical protein
MGLVIAILLSWGAVYGLNRYLGPDADPHETTGSARAPHPSTELTGGLKVKGK